MYIITIGSKHPTSLPTAARKKRCRTRSVTVRLNCVRLECPPFRRSEVQRLPRGSRATTTEVEKKKKNWWI